MEKFYVTTPIYYVNDVPSIGHAYTTIAADILARWHKLKGYDVFFLTGTDEHGIKIQKTAEDKGKKPLQFCNEIVTEFKKAWKILNIDYNRFIRTTEKEHEEAVKKAVTELYKKGYIYKGNYEAFYCSGCEQYKTKSELVDGKCLYHPNKIEIRKEEAYLFKLSHFQNKLYNLIKQDKFQIFPKEKKNEVLTFIKSGLNDISISRKKNEVYWSIELPFDKESTLYVWVDAFWNYLTGINWPNKDYKKYWPPDVQLMAKDILRVHATIWIALLLALEINLPKRLAIHGFLTINGQKMSKSLGNAISPEYLAKKFSSDSVRYSLIRGIPFGEDGDFSEKTLIDRHNNELANKLGNLVLRTTTLVEKYSLEKTENKLLKKLKINQVEKLFETLELDKALNEIFTFIDICNEYIQKTKPWETKDKKVLYELLHSIKAITILLSPFLPNTSEKLSKHFSFKLDFNEIKKPFKIKKIKKSEILFKKIE